MQRRGGGGRRLGAVLFTDIVGSTVVAAEMGNTRWGELVARHHRLVRRLLTRFGGHEVDTAGDGFFATFERPADAIRCAAAVTDAVRELGIEIRAGVAFGELETMDGKPGGLVVNTSARVMSVAGPGEVLVPVSVRELVPGSGISFADHGVHQLKGLDGEFRLLKVVEVDGGSTGQPLAADEAAERRREIFPTTERRRAPILIGAIVGLLAIAIAALVLLTGDEGSRGRAGGPAPLAQAVATFDPTSGAIGTPIPLGISAPTHQNYAYVDHPLVVGEGAVWVLHPTQLFHVDPRHREVRDAVQIEIGQSQTVATGFDSVWVLSGIKVYRVNPATDESSLVLELREPPGISTFSAALARDLWVSSSDGTLVRIDPRTGTQDQVDTGVTIDAVAATADSVWVTDIVAGGVVELDPGTLVPVGRPVSVPGSLDQIAAGDQMLWILDELVGTVTRLDTDAREVTGSTRVGDDASDLVVTDEAVWVTDHSGAIYRIDPSTLATERFDVPAEVLGLGVDRSSGEVWIYVGAAIGG